MSAREQSDLIELSAEQILTVRGAANAIVDAVDDPGIEIDDQFDPVRRDHLAAASEELAEALTTLASDGTWRGRMPPSEQQALRDAIGAVEAMTTPPESERLRSLGYRIDDNDMTALGAALDGVPAPDRMDLAYSDFRFGGYDEVLKRRTDWDGAMRAVRTRQSGSSGDTRAREQELRDFDGRQLIDATCDATDRLLVEQLASAASLAETGGLVPDRENISVLLYSNVEDILDGDRYQHDCYRAMDERRIRAAQKRISEAVERGAQMDAESYAFGAAEMVLWAQSNRLREQRIGLR